MRRMVGLLEGYEWAPWPDDPNPPREVWEVEDELEPPPVELLPFQELVP
jgi:hypothetical protein